eukprot:gene12561-8609_t
MEYILNHQIVVVFFRIYIYIYIYIYTYFVFIPQIPPPTTSPQPRIAVVDDDDAEIRLMAAHLNCEPPPPPTIPLYALPDQEYLEATVLPLLLRGLEELSKVRPPDPLTFIAAYLVGNNPQRSATPLLNNLDGRRVPLMDIALRAAAGFEVNPPPKDLPVSTLDDNNTPTLSTSESESVPSATPQTLFTWEIDEEWHWGVFLVVMDGRCLVLYCIGISLSRIAPLFSPPYHHLCPSSLLSLSLSLSIHNIQYNELLYLIIFTLTQSNANDPIIALDVCLSKRTTLRREHKQTEDILVSQRRVSFAMQTTADSLAASANADANSASASPQSSSSSTPPTRNTSEYERGKADAERHRRATEPNWIRPTLGPILWFGAPLLLYVLYTRRTRPPGAAKNPFGDMMDFMMPKREFRVDVQGTRFADVVGIPEAKEEVKQYVEFLVHPNKYTRLGARLPKGCLLTGEPGTGKTLLAKAVAGEASVPFFSCNGADFIELMGGSGPKRVRELFAEARKAAPAIIFIDEIDGVGSRQGKKGGSVSTEENRTINQLLAELDGLSTSADPIVVMAATNFQDNIDKALLREGRFDRKIQIEMPDIAARREVFEHYLKKICTGDPKGRTTDENGTPLPLDPAISNAELAAKLAHLTPGLSPATIATVVNEAALQCGIQKKPLVDFPSFTEAVDATLIGKKHRNRQSDTARRRTAIHEAGHTLTAWMLPVIQPVLKVSITPRGSALGVTQRAGSEHHEYQTNATLFADLVVMMGGRAAEEVLLGNVSAGAVDDLQRATGMALQQMMAFGMSANVGLLAYHPEYTGAGRDFTVFSDEAQNRAEMEARRLLDAAYETATGMVKTHREKMEVLVERLLEKSELRTEDIEALWGTRPTEPTKPALLEMVQRSPKAPPSLSCLAFFLVRFFSFSHITHRGAPTLHFPFPNRVCILFPFHDYSTLRQYGSLVGDTSQRWDTFHNNTTKGRNHSFATRAEGTKSLPF